MTENRYSLNINQIQKFLPHRAPFLLVDRILEIHPVGDLSAPPPQAQVGTRVIGLKSVSFNEPYFQGHFPNFAIMPGVLIIETMAQVASFSTYPAMEKDLDRLAKTFQCILAGVDGARFRKPVVPGDLLRIQTEVVRCRGKLWVFQCSASVEGKTVAEVELIANMIANSNLSEERG